MACSLLFTCLLFDSLAKRESSGTDLYESPWLLGLTGFKMGRILSTFQALWITTVDIFSRSVRHFVALDKDILELWKLRCSDPDLSMF